MQTLRTTGECLLVAIVAAFLAYFWPQTLGGKTAYVKVDGHSMDPTYHFGDLAIVRRQSSYKIGDPVAYRIPKGEFGAGAMVIHRLIGGNGKTGFVTRGDNRNINDSWHPKTKDVVGRVRIDMPALGTQMAKFTRPVYLGALVAGLTVMVMLFPSGDDRDERDERDAGKDREPAKARRRGRHAAIRQTG
jgi:signal peptidase